MARDTHGPVVTIVAHDVGLVGGMERQLSELIQGLLAYGAAVTLISRTCELEPHGNLRWVRVPGPARPFSIAYPWFFLAGSLLVRRYRRGLLHTTGAVVWNRADVSTVHLCHSGSDAGIARVTKEAAYYRLNARIAARLSSTAERLVYRPQRSRALVCVSGLVAAQVRRNLPAAPLSVVIPNGVDSQAFAPNPRVRADVRAELGVEDRDLVALFVGGDWKRKGLGIAIDAVRRTPDWSLLVVGAGDPSRYSSAHDGRLRFVGPTAAPARYYAASDVFVLPSGQEGDPLVVYEAAAAGLPVLSTDVGEVRRVVVDGRSGWIVPRDPERIAEKLVLLRDHDLRARLGAGARSAVSGLDWRTVSSRYLALYLELESERNRLAAAPVAEHGA